ncbi:MAG: NERD domain-containing protein, partial [Comamonadaceae bacterium]
MHAVLAHKTIEETVDAFFQQFPFGGDVDQFASGLKRDAPSKDALKYALWPWADRYLTGALFFKSDALAQELGLDPTALKDLFASLSLRHGELADKSPEQLFLDNPVWQKPIVALANDELFCALPQTLLSFVHSIVDKLVEPHPRLAKKLSDTRAVFLEREVERMLRSAFPQAQVATQYKWRTESQMFEADLMLRFDTTILLVEAKSGKVSWSALRGAPSSLIGDVRKLIVEPSEQSGRLAAQLQQEIERRKQGQPPQMDFPLPLENVTAVMRLSVSLHDFATVQSVPLLLADAGVLNNQFPLAPCISLADLE